MKGYQVDIEMPKMHSGAFIKFEEVEGMTEYERVMYLRKVAKEMALNKFDYLVNITESSGE